jgi:hypothetical protein
MKCSELIFKGTGLLKEKGIAAPRLEAEVLLAFAWGRERTHLLVFSDDEVPREVEDRFHDLLCQRSRGVPVAYLTGEKEFMSLGFYVNPDVLIPRPETELLVERVLEYLAGFPGEEPVPELERGTEIEVVNPGRGGGRVPEPETELPPYFPAACCKTPSATVISFFKTSSISSFVTPPGLRRSGRSPAKLMIVDSTPTSVDPPSRIRSIFPSRSARTCCALVGLGRPEILALGAARGAPLALIKSRAILLLG